MPSSLCIISILCSFSITNAMKFSGSPRDNNNNNDSVIKNRDLKLRHGGIPGQCPLDIRPPTGYRSNSNMNSNNNKKEQSRPSLITIGHRGSSFNIPQHTLAGYRLALELGADYIELDLVTTKDSQLICSHSIDLSITTDVATKYPSKYRTNVTVGKTYYEGNTYFAHDFTLTEIKTLKIKRQQFLLEEAKAVRSSLLDGLLEVPTLVEAMDLLKEWNDEVRPTISYHNDAIYGRAGMYVEFKVPDGIKNDIIQRDADVDAEFVSIYTPKLFLQTLKAYPHARNMFFGGYSTATNNTNDRTGTVTNFGCENKGSYQVPPLVIECFYKSALKYIHRTIQGNSIVDSKNPPVEFEKDEYFNGAVPPFVYLLSNRSCHKESFWDNIVPFDIPLSASGPDKECLFRNDDNGSAGGIGNPQTGINFVQSALERGLVVHAWTERLEKSFVHHDNSIGISAEKTNTDSAQFISAEEELIYLYCTIGIHGIFAENVDLAVRVGRMGCPDNDILFGTDKNNNGINLAAVGLGASLIGLVVGSTFAYWYLNVYRIGKNTKRDVISASDDIDHYHHDNNNKRPTSAILTNDDDVETEMQIL